MSGATVGQILSQARKGSVTTHMWGIVTSVGTVQATVQLQPGGVTDCEIPDALTLVAGDRVLVLVAPIGNVVLTKMPALALTETVESP